MTWVIGIPSLDIAVIFGDIRVSLGMTEVTDFGVRKVFALSALSAVGFAGSVRVCLRQVERLRQCATVLGPRAEVPEIIDAWFADASASYERRFAKHDRALGCALIMVGASDKLMVSAEKGQPVGPFHQTHGYVVHFPLPGKAAEPPQPIVGFGASIGSGNTELSYRESLRDFASEAVLKFASGDSAESRATMAHVVLSMIFTGVVERSPKIGVAPQFLGAVITPEGILFGDSYYEGITGTPLPPLAGTWNEVGRYARKYGIAPALRGQVTT